MSNVITIFPGHSLTMSSREIAELTGKQHKHVLADIRQMLSGLGKAAAEFSAAAQVKGPNNSIRAIEVFNLPKRETLILVSGYSVTLRARIIDRWIELEAAAAAAAAQQVEPAHDVVAEWFAARVVTGQAVPPGGWPRTSVLYADFCKWAIAQGYCDDCIPARNVFGARLKKMPGVKSRHTKTGTAVTGATLGTPPKPLPAAPAVATIDQMDTALDLLRTAETAMYADLMLDEETLTAIRGTIGRALKTLAPVREAVNMAR